MNTLWAFGDSMTFGHGCNLECVSETKIEYDSYRNIGDDIWTNHLGKLLNYNVINLGRNGASNDYIFDTIIENYDRISENDVVIINTTLYGRIEVPFRDGTYNILSGYENDQKTDKSYIKSIMPKDEDDEKIDALVNFQYHFSNHVFYKNRHIKRFEFIQNRLIKDKKLRYVYMWSLQDDDAIYRSFKTIKDDTNGKINDGHFSYNGHLNFAHYIFSLMDSKKLL